MVTRRDPFAELGLPPDASPSAVKAAWRRLAREHHPDLARDRTEERAATRRMARINAAYEAALRIAEDRRAGRGPIHGAGAPAGDRGRDGEPPGRARHGRSRTAGDEKQESGRGDGDAGAGRASGRTRPATRRVDTSAVFHAAGVHGSGRSVLPGQPPRPPDRPGPEALRGAPSGPVERHRPQRPPSQRQPDLDDARAHVLTFGKFHDRTLGEVERVEPTYIDWIVRAIRRDWSPPPNAPAPCSAGSRASAI